MSAMSFIIICIGRNFLVLLYTVFRDFELQQDKLHEFPRMFIIASLGFELGISKTQDFLLNVSMEEGDLKMFW